MFDYNNEKYQGQWVYLPTIGNEAVFDIKEIREVKSANKKINFKQRIKTMVDSEEVEIEKDLGYHVEAELKNGKILSITSLSAFLQVFKQNNIQDGEKVLIRHVEKGEWEIERIE